MKRTAILPAVILILLMSGPASPATASRVEAGNSDLDVYEAWQVTWMYDQEKLARDLANKFLSRWGDPEFLTTAAAEQRHMDELLAVMNLYGLDPLIQTDTDGEFGDERHSDAFSSLMSRGWQSQRDAYIAAAYLEEWDIQEFTASIADSGETRLTEVYSWLLAGAREQLRFLVSRVLGHGSSYEAQILSQSEVDAICSNVQPGTAPDFFLNAGLNDAWYYPLQPGQGYFVTVYPDSRTLFVGWLTFDTQKPEEGAVSYLGDAGQRWLVAQGPYEGMQGSLEIYSVGGGLFDRTTPIPVENVIGHMTLQFEDCAHGSIRYDLGSIYQGGVIPIQRISSENMVQCEALSGLPE